VARLNFNAQSDIDLLVDLESGRSLFDLSGFLAEVKALLKCPVDAVTERGLKPRIREDVLRDARPL
jgi:predicted nucleotidyltransferase